MKELMPVRAIGVRIPVGLRLQRILADGHDLALWLVRP